MTISGLSKLHSRQKQLVAVSFLMIALLHLASLSIITFADMNVSERVSINLPKYSVVSNKQYEKCYSANRESLKVESS